MTDIFAAIGFITTGTACITLLLLVVNAISEAIHEAAWVYKYRHRFDKPPKAACYCIDCKFHGDVTDRIRCTKRKDVVFQTADEFFCQDAEPKTKEES